jgi:hypothetical protein
MMDRDVVAAVNLSWRGRLRFDRSRAQKGLEGGAVEAVKGNPTATVILRVDASKTRTKLNLEQPAKDLTEPKTLLSASQPSQP